MRDSLKAMMRDLWQNRHRLDEMRLTVYHFQALIEDTAGPPRRYPRMLLEQSHILHRLPVTDPERVAATLDDAEYYPQLMRMVKRFGWFAHTNGPRFDTTVYTFYRPDDPALILRLAGGNK